MDKKYKFLCFSRWSNVNRPGQWVFKIGPIPDGENIKTPDNVEGNARKDIKNFF